jgi:hypothetical protein
MKPVICLPNINYGIEWNSRGKGRMSISGREFPILVSQHAHVLSLAVLSG